MEEINVGEKVLYKKDKEGKWRGPAGVLGMERKTVVVKQGSDVREINRSHVIKVKKMEDYFENNENKGESNEDEEEMVGMVERREVGSEEEETENRELKRKRKLMIAILKKKKKQWRRRSSRAMKRRLKMGTRVKGRREW